MKTINELLIEESKRFDNVVYLSKPYSCCLDECLGYFAGYILPAPDRFAVERTEKETKIIIKPLKGSGKRKPYIINMWVS
jgi:hypothetical protein